VSLSETDVDAEPSADPILAAGIAVELPHPVDSDRTSETAQPLPYIPPPKPESDVISMLMVNMRPTGDKMRDNLRMRQTYGTLISYPGSDRFAFVVYERGHSYQIEFPNFTTGVNPELLARLKRLVGADNVKVEQLTFQ
jgi:hypothetical protein